MHQYKKYTMKKINQLIGLSVLLILILSCDPIYHATIKNRSTKDIQVEIYFDSTQWGHRPFIPLLRLVRSNTGGQLIKYDTIDLILLYKVDKDSSFILTGGIGLKPNYQDYKKIIIYSNDTTVLDNPVKIENAMLENGSRNWEMNIK